MTAVISRSGRTIRRAGRQGLLPIVGLGLGAAIWQVLGSLEISPALPPLDRVLVAFWDLVRSDRFQEALTSTVISVAMTFPPTVLAGIIVGVAMARNRWVDWALTPYLNLALSLPLVSLIPVFLLVFGLGRATVAAVIVVYSLPAVVVNTIAGVRGVDAELVELARSVTASRWLTVRRVLLPSALPLVMAGVRIAAGRSIKGAVIAEQVIGLVGVGGLIQRLGGAFAVEELYAVVLFVGLSGVLILWIIGKLERGAVVAR